MWFLNFENLSLKWPWEDAGGGCNVAVTTLPRREVGSADGYWRAPSSSARIFSGGLCTTTFEPPPASSHETPVRDFRKFKNTTPKISDPVVYHMIFFGLGNSTLCETQRRGRRAQGRQGLQLTTSLAANLAQRSRAASSWTPTTSALPAGLS